MIHVELQPEPPDFDSKVRQPGQSDLGICAYSSLYIPRGTGARSVDHLLPKSKHRAQTYEWSNYRLACVRMNARKNALERVLDPFEVQDGWFALELSTLQVIPGEALPADLRHRVEETIALLDLNDDEFIQARAAYYEVFQSGEMPFSLLRKHFPFLARELIRQGLVRESI